MSCPPRRNCQGFLRLFTEPTFNSEGKDLLRVQEKYYGSGRSRAFCPSEEQCVSRELQPASQWAR